MGLLNDLKFRLVRAAGRLLRPLIKVIDPRRTPLPGQVELRPARTVRWDRSKLTYIGPKPFWWDRDEFKLEASWRAEITNAEVIGKGVVITSDGAVILESTLFQRSYFRRSHVEHLIVGRRFVSTEKFDHAVPLTNYLDISYFHWTLESIGRLALVENELKERSLHVLIGDRPSRYMRDTITFLLALERDRIVHGAAKRKLISRCLMVSNPHSRDEEHGRVEVYPPEHIQWLNARGHERIGGLRGERRNFIISRRLQRGRRIMNEALLLQRFPQLNFELVALEELSVRDQVDLFAHAGVIIGVHGAGLTNLVYAKDAAVIELYPTQLQEKNTAYFVQIASCLGLPHLMLHFEGVGPAPHWDLTLNEEQLGHMEKFLRAHGRLA
jgi:capsular polysaccharide biosynthesis protein